MLKQYCDWDSLTDGQDRQMDIETERQCFIEVLVLAKHLKDKSLLFIMMPHECHDVSNHQQLNCLFNKLY